MKCTNCDKDLTLDDLLIETSHWQGGSLTSETINVRCKLCGATLKNERQVYDTDLYERYGFKVL